jgi:hypothetical protein
MQSGPGLPVSQRRSFVLLPRVQDETTYAVALHELGHCLHPLGRVHRIEGSAHFRATGQYSSFNDLRLLLLAERSAWEWAHHYALEWTPVMTYVEDWALSEYKRMAREKYGMKV